MQSYKHYNALLTGRNKNSRKLANNTYAIRHTDTIAIRLHSTDIITYHLNGHITFDDGGWRTVTTKARINKFSPYWISQEKGVWHIGTRAIWQQGRFEQPGKSHLYYTGITLNRNGNPLRVRKTDGKEKLRKQITAYIAKLKALDILPKPGSGDCILCRLNDTDCLEQHLDEKYIRGSLIMNALKVNGTDGDGVAIVWHMFNRGNKQHVINSVRRYFKRNLGIA